LQKEGRGAIADADIFNSPAATKSNLTTNGGKALALGILKKAAASKQNDLRRSKGFGIVLPRQKNVLPAMVQKDSAAATPTVSEDSVSSPSSSEGSSSNSVCNDGDKAAGSSLSLLGGYGMDSSDSD
jgi:hypothetical protein